MYIFKIKWVLSLSFNQLNSNQLKLKEKQTWGVALLVKSLSIMHKALDSVPVLYKLVVLMHQGISRGVGELCNNWRIAFGSVLMTHYWALCICSKTCSKGTYLLHALSEAGCLCYLVWMWYAIQVLPMSWTHTMECPSRGEVTASSVLWLTLGSRLESTGFSLIALPSIPSFLRSLIL